MGEKEKEVVKKRNEKIVVSRAILDALGPLERIAAEYCIESGRWLLEDAPITTVDRAGSKPNKKK